MAYPRICEEGGGGLLRQTKVLRNPFLKLVKEEINKKRQTEGEGGRENERERERQRGRQNVITGIVTLLSFIEKAGNYIERRYCCT